MNHGRSREWDFSRFTSSAASFFYILMCGSQITLLVANCVRVRGYFFAFYRFLLLEDFLVCIRHYYKGQCLWAMRKRSVALPKGGGWEIGSRKRDVIWCNEEQGKKDTTWLWFFFLTPSCNAIMRKRYRVGEECASQGAPVFSHSE